MENLGKGQVSERNVMEDVGIMLNSDYCTGEEKFTFFRLPKCLVDDVCFAELSGAAKLLYALFLDRVSLSIKNGQIDEQGRVFIYYSVKSICEDLNCGTQKACKILDELEKKQACLNERGKVLVSMINFIGEMVAKYAEVMDLDSLPDPDHYLLMKRIKQLYVEFYKPKNIVKFRNTKISIERKVVA